MKLAFKWPQPTRRQPRRLDFKRAGDAFGAALSSLPKRDHASGGVVECRVQAVGRSQKRVQNDFIGCVAQAEMNQAWAVPARGHQAMEVVIFGADHEVVLRRKVAQLGIG